MSLAWFVLLSYNSLLSTFAQSYKGGLLIYLKGRS
jgi:hypothetical protein